MNNPCRFKRQCNTCTVALLSDRPSFCQQIGCEHYTPCKRCKNNKILDENQLCDACVKGQKAAEKKEKELNETFGIVDDGDLPLSVDESKAFKPREIKLSMPGTPPSEYTDQEKEIYQAQWKEYTGFYRDPTSKAVVHSIIILEIELNWTLNQQISSRAAPNKDLEQQRQRLIRSLSELHDQLPKKEAGEESDDEKFLSMVYESYIKELQDRRIGKVSRIISPEAIALAPVLHFPINPQEILTDLGYRQVDAIQACGHILLDDLPKEPEKVLEFFNFYLTEKYALPIENQILLQDDEEERLPAVASPAQVSPIEAGLSDDADDTE